MPAINFQKQFCKPIRDGFKVHTIRAKRQDGRDPKPGQTLYLYTGMRTKSCKKLAQVPCRRVRPIELEVTPHTLTATIDTVRLDQDWMASFAVADGFNSSEAMREFFWRFYGGDHMPSANRDVLRLWDMLLIQWAETLY